MDYVRDGKIQGQCVFKKTKERPCISPSLTYVVHVTELISFLVTGENGTKVMFQHLKIECFCWSFLTISCKKDTTKPKTKFLSVVKVRQFRNDFFKPTFLPKNERRNSTLLLVDLISFVFWKKVKTPKRLFEIN